MVAGTAMLTDEPPQVKRLATEWFALGSCSIHDRSFITYLLIFAAILWGTIGRGAFYRLDLAIFTLLSVAAVARVPRFWKAVTATRWLWLPALAMIVGIVVSAGVNHQFGDVGYALAPIVAAISLGLAGVALSGAHDRKLVMRIVVDVACLAAILGWLGVAFHLHAFAQPLSQGWRATATIGYANVTGLVLFVGLLCSCGLAAASGHMGDQVRCWLLATGVFATQSRSVILAMALCWLAMYFSHRVAAKALGLSVACALVAFAGLLPSIRGATPNVAIATAGAALALLSLIFTSRMMKSKLGRVMTWLLPACAAPISIYALNARIGDSRSADGRLRLWNSGVADLHTTGVFGEGPHELAELSRGHIVTLLVHSDPLQYVQYYGALGFVALLAISWGLSVALARSRSTVSREVWTTALTVVIAVAVVALVDFSLQVPLVLGVTSLVIGAAIGSACKPSSGHNRPLLNSSH